MLLNPFKDPPDRFCIEHSRVLGEGFLPNQFAGTVLKDLQDPTRLWTLACFYMPLRSRALQGVRAKFIDQKGFITFCNQRDLELLLGFAKPGMWCPWTNSPYPELDGPDFYGFFMDYEDCVDDLHGWEMAKRQEYWQRGFQAIPETFSITRHLHLEARVDVEQVDLFLHDYDPVTGLSPDFDVQHISHRWRRVERNSVSWNHT
jgi:hypothetical protein